MLDIRTSIRSSIVSIALADDIWRLLIEYREIANPELARRFLEQLLVVAEANGEGDQTYAEFLADIAPNENITQVVAAERERRRKVASHVRGLLGRIDA
jgi:hypothetical protein